MDDLGIIKQGLRDSLGNQGQFDFLAIRLILRTGVDLARAERGQVDPVAAAKVRAVLAEMGIALPAA